MSDLLIAYFVLKCVMIFSGIITFHCCLVTHGTCAVSYYRRTMCFSLMADFVNFFVFIK